MGLSVARKVELGAVVETSRSISQGTGRPRGRLQFANFLLAGGLALVMGGTLVVAVTDYSAKARTIATSQAVRHDSSYKPLPECPPIRGAKSDPKNHISCTPK